MRRPTPAEFSMTGPFLQPLLPFLLLLGSAAAIYFACEFFVNGVEWLGRRLSVGSTATATILAAFGTALPESAITFVAVAFGKSDAQRWAARWCWRQSLIPRSAPR
ncbi:MAG: hypothetical protein NVSMB69_14610 [Novosphingobium sp.]